MRKGLLICWLLIHGVAFSQNAGVISGEIRGMDGKPARGIRVAATGVWDSPDGPTPGRQPERLGTTDNAGRYRLENVPSGRYFLIAGRIDTPSLYPGTKNSRDAKILTVVSGFPLEQVDFQLVQPPGVSLSGRVVPDGVKIPSTITLFSPPGPAWFREDVPVMKDGTFTFRGVPPNAYDLSVFSDGYIWNGSVVVKDKPVAGVRVVATSFAQPRGEIEFDAHSPLPKFSLALRGKLGRTTAGIGRIAEEGGVFSTLPAGEYRVSVEGLPKEYRVESFAYGNTDLLKRSINIEGGISTFRLKLGIAQPARLRHIRGKVLGVEHLQTTSHVRLSGAALLEPKDLQLNQDGSYEFSNIISGTYTLTAGHSEPRTVVVGDADIDGADLLVPAIWHVRGRILMEDGGPLPRSDISFSKGSRTAYGISRAPGTFEAALVEGESTIQVFGFPSDGYRIRSITFGDTDLLAEPLRISGPESPDIVVTLARTTSLFRVTGRASSRFSASELPLRDPKVVLWGPAGTLQTPVSGDGSFEFSRVPPGTYNATFPGSNSLSVTVVDRDVLGINIPAAPTTTMFGSPPTVTPQTEPIKRNRIRGRVKAPAGRLPSRILLWSGEQNLESLVDADGRFEFPALAPGFYNISTEPRDEISPSRIIVGTRNLDSFELSIFEKRQVHGRVVVAGDSPMPRAWLRLIPDVVSSLRWVSEAVAVQANGRFTMTPTDGDYRVELLSVAAPYRVQSIRHGSQDLLREKLKVSAESSQEIVVMLELIPSMPWIRAEGRVEGAARIPPSAKVVLLGDPSRFFLESSIGENGSFVLPKVPPGTYTMRIDPVAFGVAPKTVSLNQDASGLELAIPEQQQLTVRLRAGDGRLPGISFNIRSSDGKGFQYLWSPELTAPIPLGRVDTECISDVCGRALTRLLNEPVVVRENSTATSFALKLPEGEYRLTIEYARGHVVTSMTQGTTDLLKEPLKLTGGNSPDVVVTFGPAP